MHCHISAGTNINNKNKIAVDIKLIYGYNYTHLHDITSQLNIFNSIHSKVKVIGN
jgi:hypothetical protein